WACCGVPTEVASEYGLGRGAVSYTFLGRERVGGCLKVFCTKEELEKHLNS
ncbi:hypothetical protein B0H16DRAFT_1275686, partial [Mycena metata]